MGTLSTHSALCSATLTERAGCWAKQGRTSDHITLSFLFRRPRHVPEAGQLNLQALQPPQLPLLTDADHATPLSALQTFLSENEGSECDWVCSYSDPLSDVYSETRSLYDDIPDLRREGAAIERCLSVPSMSVSSLHHLVSDLAVLVDGSMTAIEEDDYSR